MAEYVAQRGFISMHKHARIYSSSDDDDNGDDEGSDMMNDSACMVNMFLRKMLNDLRALHICCQGNVSCT